MFEIIIQAAISVLCVFGAYFIYILLSREIIYGKSGRMITAIVSRGPEGLESDLWRAKKYYGRKIGVVIVGDPDERELRELEKRHPEISIYVSREYGKKGN